MTNVDGVSQGFEYRGGYDFPDPRGTATGRLTFETIDRLRPDVAVAWHNWVAPRDRSVVFFTDGENGKPTPRAWLRFTQLFPSPWRVNGRAWAVAEAACGNRGMHCHQMAIGIILLDESCRALAMAFASSTPRRRGLGIASPVTSLMAVTQAPNVGKRCTLDLENAFRSGRRPPYHRRPRRLATCDTADKAVCATTFAMRLPTAQTEG